MAQLKIRDLHDLLRQAQRRRDLEQDGIRLVYDGTALHMSTADAPDTAIARANTCGFTTEPWDVTRAPLPPFPPPGPGPTPDEGLDP
ncbi:hypothetical protein ABZ759_30820 [Streptomyces sp. NPDC047860]|uniref:hypothetical protein n=1 Tax=Streptomyces sp. NPDC047860 TaxID=3155743 RepID=UPI0033E933AC